MFNKFISTTVLALLTFGANAGIIDTSPQARVQSTQLIEAPIILQARAPNGALIQLHDQEGPCVKGAKLATWVSPDMKEKIQGCWKTDGEVLTIGWFDGEPSAIPMKAFLASQVKPNS